MKREDKNTIIDSLTEFIGNSKHFYLADISDLDAESTSKLRRICFEKEIQLVVVKNTLLRKALEKFEGKFEELYSLLNNSTSIIPSVSLFISVLVSSIAWITSSTCLEYVPSSMIYFLSFVA